MRVYIAGISGDTQYVKGTRSFYEIKPRPGDYKKDKTSGRGDISRMVVGEDFYQHKEFDAIALFDMDMRHPPDILERLREDMERGNLDMVTGHYYSRNSTYLHSVCWGVGDGKWPFIPMMDPPRSGIHEIGVTGMGCVLIKREVYEAVQNHLPKGDRPFCIGPAPEVTGDSRTLGTDFRFFSLARLLGYRLWLDADIESLHATMFWVGREIAEKLDESSMDYEYLGAISEQIREADGMDKKYLETRVQALQARLKEIGEKRDKAAASAENFTKQFEAVQMVISEDLFLIEQLEKDGEFPKATEAEKAVMIENRRVIPGVSEQEAKIARDGVMQREAQGLIEDLQQLRTSGGVPGTPD